MAAAFQTASGGQRPSPLHSSQSFTRLEKKLSDAALRRRANTTQVTTGLIDQPDGSIAEIANEQSDVFAGDEDSEQNGQTQGLASSEDRLLASLSDLPIELQSLVERFLESLSAKIHPTPMTADTLSQMFQDFYDLASAQISTHIATLSARIGRDKANLSSSGHRSSKTRSRAGSATSNASTGGGEMLTATEVSERRKARRLLEVQRLALEDAVEKIVCERVYDRIWKHRSTDDDERDEKLRSRSAALSLIGVGFRELHADSGPDVSNATDMDHVKEDEVSRLLAPARTAILQMDEEKSPLGKLQRLTAAHKSIVETLSRILPSTSSADEVLPTLIYTLITLPSTGTHAVSNLNFIQRFRTSRKIDGESAYCLVNLEAAIVFLETVDVSSIRNGDFANRPGSKDGEVLQEKPSVSHADDGDPRAVTPSILNTHSLVTITAPIVMSHPTQNASESLKASTSERPALHQRRISSMLQTQADRIGAGRENFLSAADRVYESINGSLENSLQFVFGRFKDQTLGTSSLPKTLDEARRLISSATSKNGDMPDQDAPRTPLFEEPGPLSRSESKMLDLIGGRRLTREKSTESMRSASSGKRSVSAQEATIREKPRDETTNVAGNLLSQINQINPLNRFGVPVFARFGRGPTPVAPFSPPTNQNTVNDRGSKLKGIEESDGSPSPTSILVTDDDAASNARARLIELKKVRPPKKRFLELDNVNELKIGEVEELLTEYRRLAKALAQAIAE